MTASILLIDDDRFARQVYGDALRAVGWQVRTAPDGEAGLEILSGDGVDVVVLDMLLPGMDGHTVLSEARRIDPDVGVVVISALDRVESAVRAIKAGAFDYLIKPVSSETLEIAVRRCLELRGLLRENVDLKQSLALAQTGARMTGDMEARAVYRHLVDGVLAHTGVARALVATVQEDAVQLEADGGEGPPAEDLLPTVQTLRERLAAGGAQAVDGGTALPVPGSEPAAALLLLGDPPPEGDLRSVFFLLRHASQALSAIRRYEAARGLAYEDDLTGLFNARYLDRILDQQVEQARARDGRFGVLFMDLDHFKQVNDTHGHLVGSKLLEEMALLLRACIRDVDVAVRYGGDEYVVVLPDAGPETAMNVAERIRARIAEHDFLAREGLALKITVSVGVACLPEHAGDKGGVLDMADRAMYEGKRASRNVVYLAEV